jgi:hypothetical protein
MCKEYITGKNIQSEKQASKKFTEWMHIGEVIHISLSHFWTDFDKCC